jgi:DNA processing protein
VAKRLSADAARSGIVTVSGMARGIDTEVHRSTMDAQGVTWAVLGSGLDRIYPPENADLAERIVAQGGALISEVPMSGRPLASNFPRRNRVISGLAWGTVVVEGDGKSGALITARCSAEQGREVLAVPGPVDSPMSEGPLRLIRDGAVMVRQWGDVLEALPLLAAAAQARPGKAEISDSDEVTLGPEERRILELIGAEETQLEELLTVSGLGLDRLAVALLSLEMKGRIRSCPGQRYAKK